MEIFEWRSLYQPRCKISNLSFKGFPSKKFFLRIGKKSRLPYDYLGKIINCGFESPTYCQTEKNPPIIFHCVDDKTLTNCSGNIPDFTKSPELTFYEYCGYTVTQSIPTTTLISSIGNKTVPVTITITDNTGNKSSCTFNLTISARVPC